MERSDVERLVEEMVSIRRLVEILAKDALRTGLEAVATTDIRKKVYAMIDGSTNTEDIAKRSGLSIRSIQDVVKKLMELDLVTVPKRGFPKRRFDWVPTDWRSEIAERQETEAPQAQSDQ